MSGRRLCFLGALALAMIGLVSAAESDKFDMIDKISRTQEVAYRLKQAIKLTKQSEGPIQMTVRLNFLNTLRLMANASAITGAEVSRSAGAVIRGFVQDSFTLGSLGTYLPRLIFLDGPSQFIEVLRLVRTNQIRIPSDLDSAIDTLIIFATMVRDSPAVTNIPFLPFFPNVFRGAELLSTEVLYGVFSWLTPIAPQDISAASVEALWNRWDVKSSTTSKYT